MFQFKNEDNITMFLNIIPNLIQSIKPSGMEGCSTISYQEDSIRGKMQYVLVQGMPEEVHTKLFGKAKDTEVGDQSSSIMGSAYWRAEYNNLREQYAELLEQLKHFRSANAELEEKKILLSKELSVYRESNTNLSARCAELQHKLRDEASVELEEKNKRLSCQYEILKTNYNYLEEKKEEWRTDAQTQFEANLKLAEQVNALTKKEGQLRLVIANLEQKLKDLKNGTLIFVV